MHRPSSRPHRALLGTVLGALLLVSASGCSSSSSSSGSASSTAVKQKADMTSSASAGSSSAPATSSSGAASTVVVRSAGCGKPAPALGTVPSVGDVPQEITVGGVTRTYRLAVPAGNDNTTPHGLILNLHGSGSNAIQQSAYSLIPATASKQGYVVITPDAVNANWRLFGSRATTSPDLDFATALLDDAEQRFCINTRRVYADGISLGAAFAADLACALPDRIAAIGLVAVEVPFEPCRPVPLVVFHGTADKVVPYGKGVIGASPYAGRDQPGTDALMTRWARINRCSPTPSETTLGTDVTKRTWSDCAPRTEVTLYKVEGAGHVWPGSPVPVPRLGANTKTVSATELILALFGRHQLPRPA